jgi:hypothetical protein
MGFLQNLGKACYSVFFRRQRSEQYFTSSQFFCHFFRQLKAKPQQAQIF